MAAVPIAWSGTGKSARELVLGHALASPHELREAIARWLHVYNHVQPHEALVWMTPAERRAENLSIETHQAA